MARVLRAVALASVVMTSVASAEPGKAECIDAHSRGQDARDQGKLTLARKLFLTCAQSSCPQLVVNDCARWTDEVARLQPTVTFAARDSGGTDLPDTALYIDGVFVASRLDDGRPRDVDPGKHMVRFSHRGRDQTLTVVVGAGERGRSVVAIFPKLGGPQTSAHAGPEAVSQSSSPRMARPTGAVALLIGGAALTIGGVTLGAYEVSRVPNNCSYFDRQCAATPGDPVFDEAKRAVQLANVGWTIAGIGLAAGVGGAIWYFVGGSSAQRERVAIAPWLSAGSGGLSVSGSM